MNTTDDDQWMRRALELAARGQGFVEPNPMVGCVIVRDGCLLGEGWHQRFGGRHAEIEALAAADQSVDGATMYVTLEPCCHHGKTPPCTDAVIASGIRRLVIATSDPFPQVAGGGVEKLKQAGIDVTVGLFAAEARQLNEPYWKLVTTGVPWVIAKWAMTLDGKIATRTGASQWISNEASRAVVHHLRGRVDAIMIGHGTAVADDPSLTARPTGPRLATRIVCDTEARLPITSKLVQSACEVPVIVAVGQHAPSDRCNALQDSGCEVLRLSAADPQARIQGLLAELGRRLFTNVLVEGGGRLLGSLFDGRLVDEVHVFLAPTILGGPGTSPVAGLGVANVSEGQSFSPAIETLGENVYVRGRLAKTDLAHPPDRA